MIPITVHVRENRVEDFYVRFAEFIVEAPDLAVPLRLPSGTVPAWVQTDEAKAIASKLMGEISLPGYGVLRHLIDGANKETVHLRPDDLARLTQHPKGKSGIAGILGGVGKAIRRSGLPMYRTPSGGTWHYIWDWDGEQYSMTPEVAALLHDARVR
jgi:hypothetical protein